MSILHEMVHLNWSSGTPYKLVIDRHVLKQVLVRKRIISPLQREAKWENRDIVYHQHERDLDALDYLHGHQIKDLSPMLTTVQSG